MERPVARVLIVDDEESIIEIVASLLERDGHEVQSASSSAQALEAIGERPPDVAIVDLVMPGTGGLTLIMEKLAGIRGLAIVAMSGKLPLGQDSMTGLGPALHISAFLPKPFTAEELARAVKTALGARG